MLCKIIFFNSLNLYLVWNFFRFVDLLRTSFTFYAKEPVQSKVEVIQCKAAPITEMYVEYNGDTKEGVT